MTTFKEYIDLNVQKIREAWKDHDLQIKAQGAMLEDLRKRLSGYETLMEEQFGKNAVDLHTSFKDRDVKETKSPLGPEYEDIPTINEQFMTEHQWDNMTDSK